MNDKVQVLLLMYETGKSHIDSILASAELPLKVGIISALPEITGEARNSGLWSAILSVPVSDKPFWVGFAAGMRFCINNRGIAVGWQ